MPAGRSTLIADVAQPEQEHPFLTRLRDRETPPGAIGDRRARILVMKVPVAIAAFMMTTEVQQTLRPRRSRARAGDGASHRRRCIENAFLHQTAPTQRGTLSCRARARKHLRRRDGSPSFGFVGIGNIWHASPRPRAHRKDGERERWGRRSAAALDEVQRLRARDLEQAHAESSVPVRQRQATHYFLVHYEPLRSASPVSTG